MLDGAPSDRLVPGEGEHAVGLALRHERLEAALRRGPLHVLEALALGNAPVHAPAAAARPVRAEEPLELGPEARCQLRGSDLRSACHGDGDPSPRARYHRPVPARAARLAALLGAALAAACSSPGPAPAPTDAGQDATIPPVDLSAVPDPSEASGCSTPPAAGVARAKHVACASELVSGSLAMGRVGDVVLENARSRFIVRTGAESASTIGGFAGGIVDAAPQGREDLLKEIFPLFDFATARALEVVVVDAGDDDEARVRVVFEAAPLGLLAAALGGIARPVPLRGTIDYTLGGDSNALRILVRMTPNADVPGAGATPGMMALLGGNGELLQPGNGVLVDGRGTAAGAFVVSEGAAEALALRLVPEAGSVLNTDSIHLLTRPMRALIDAGRVVELEARLGIGPTAADAWNATHEDEALPVLEARGAVGDRVEIARASGEIVLRTRLDDTGTARVQLAAGDYSVRAGFDHWVDGAPSAVHVEASGGAVTPAARPSATLRIEATAAGEAVPVRVTLDDPAPGGDEVLRFVAIGPSERRVPPGAYRVTVSHGIEHDVHQEDVTLADGERRVVTAVLDRAIDTTGWVSTDFHLHSDLSTDSLHHVDDAVRTIAAEGLEVVASTDHDFITDYASIATRAGVAAWITPVAGDEVSSTVLGHIGGYPLARDADRAGAGAPPWFDRSPAEIFAAIRAQGDPALGGALVQINHPRLGGAGVFDAVGLDRATGHATADPASLHLPATTDLDDFSFDVIEVWNGYTRGGNEASFEDYLALYAAGRRFAMVGNSDSHLAQKPAGAPRSYVRVPDDARGHYAWADVAAALRRQYATVAAGIFVTADLAGPVIAGAVPLHVRVQAAPYVVVDRLRVYAGRDIAVDQPIGAVADAVRFDDVVMVPVGGATFVVARVDGTPDALPLFEFPPFGVTNPIALP